MLQKLMFFLSLAVFTNSVYHYDYEEHTQKSFTHRYNDDEEANDVEPVVPTAAADDIEKVPEKKHPCQGFDNYALNCSINAALIYNSSKKSPPMPKKLYDWCSAVRWLTNCALDWNSDCKDHSDKFFNEESIQGHIHVLEHICDDQWFVSRYDSLELCIIDSSDDWEKCYFSFKTIVDEQKNSSKDWTHYETHFSLCCARTRFRRCVLDSLFSRKRNCTHEEALVLQKFSTVVSEGDVFQDCEVNMMYVNCPDGDPRPTKAMLTMLVGGKTEYEPKNAATTGFSKQIAHLLLLFVMLFVLYYR